LDPKYLLRGGITKALITLALPIMGTSFLQMANQTVDMIWIGRLGSDAVAAIGTASFFVWLSMSLINLIQVGTEVNIAQSLGAGDQERARRFAGMALYLGVGLGAAYGLFLYIARSGLIGFFKLGVASVEGDARAYLAVMSAGMVFSFLNLIISSMFNGAGRSQLPFKVNAIGILLNIILDPIFIFNFGLGVRGAALATILSQMIVTVVLLKMLKDGVLFKTFKFRVPVSFQTIREILGLGAPVAFQRGLFTVFTILIARVIASYGPDAIAAQKIGIQIEAITYMTAQGFAAALSAFVGQNYGAGQIQRVRQGTVKAGQMMMVYGLGTSLLLYFFSEPLIRIFVRETSTVAIGVQYLKILAFSQVFMCIEMTFSGCFNALNKSIYPAVMGAVFTGLRVPFAYVLSTPGRLGISGIWWSISGSSILKGLIMLVMVSILFRYGIPKTDVETEVV
jgi:putative MATE family efflux protein